MLFTNPEDNSTCSAFLLSSHVVVTAAHCLTGILSGSRTTHTQFVDSPVLKLYKSKTSTKSLVRDRTVLRFSYHTSYNWNDNPSRRGPNYDVAVIEHTGSGWINDSSSDYMPISYMQSGIQNYQYSGIGLGVTSNSGAGTGTYRTIELNNFGLINGGLSADLRAPHKATCSGDSGGPVRNTALYSSQQRNYAAVGVFSILSERDSSSDKCGNERLSKQKPAIFNYDIVNWIFNATGMSCDRKTTFAGAYFENCRH